MSRYYCPCGWSTGEMNDPERIDAFSRHNESGEHTRMVKVNAVRDAMNRIDSIVEQSLQEADDAE